MMMSEKEKSKALLSMVNIQFLEADFCWFATYNFNRSTPRYNLPLQGAEPGTLACLSFAGVARIEFGHLEDVSCTVWFLNPFHIQCFSTFSGRCR
jgi:hypothetical protein